MAKTLKDFQKTLNKAMKVIPNELPRIVEREGLRFISDNFKMQGFNTGAGIDIWEERQTEDQDGNDRTRYRTNRVGRAGGLTKFGRRDANRAILVGHNTGPDKLKNSITATRSRHMVKFTSYKDYAARHNEGLSGMTQRQFMGPSAELDRRIFRKLDFLMSKRLK